MKKIFDFFNHEDKYFFSGLFNSAMNNFDLSLSELQNRIRSKGNKSLDIINYAFNKKRTQKDFDNNLKYLSESLIFVSRLNSFIANKNKTQITQIDIREFLPIFLKEMYKVLNCQRNFFTHYYHEEIVIENEEIFNFLNYIMFNSANRVKEDKVKIETLREKLLKKYKDDFKTLIEIENKKITQKNIELIAKGEKTIKKIPELPDSKGRDFAINEAVRLFLYNNKEENQTELTKYANSEYFDDQKLSQFGLIQLLALFLDKKQINLLFDNINYTRKEDDTDFQKLIARWVFTYESYRPINRLFKSEYDNDALLLQMTSELSKCPKELYPNLNEKDKSEFLEDINIYIRENSGFLDDDALVSHEVINKRYEDKFPYFAIRFLDEFGNFPSLRFQVNMGKFMHNTTTKKFESTKLETERRILENLTVFEKLSIATDKKNRYFIENEGLEKDQDWVEYPRPSYKPFENNIGIWLKTSNNLGSTTAPKVRGKNKLSKSDILEKLELQDTLKKPVAYLSFNELPALLYALLIERKTPNDIERKIIDKINLQKRLLFDHIKNIESLDRAQLDSLPNKLRSIIEFKDKPVNYKKLINSLKKEIEVNPLATIRNKYKKSPKNENILTLSEKGKIATWLSDDIKRFVPKDKKENWKGYQFAEFQALLSMYDINQDKVKNFLVQDLGIDYLYVMPFKGVDFSFNNLKSFYENYLRKRKAYLEELLQNIENKQKDELLLPFIRQKFEIIDLLTYKERLLSNPVMLQRGIFDSKPTTADKNEKNTTQFADWFIVSNDRLKAQEFYSYKKHYSIAKEVKNNKSMEIKNTIDPSKGIKCQYLPRTTKEQQNQIFKNEIEIRKTMRNDFYILQMIKHVIKNNIGTDTTIMDDINLKEFYLTKAEKLKYEANSKIQSLKEKGDKSDVIYNQSYILSKPVPISLLNGKIIDQVKLKDLSKYKKYSQDERIVRLVSYFDKKWNLLEIENEINDYDLVRSKQFFKTVHDLEAEIYKYAEINKCLNEIQLDSIPNFKKYVSYFFLNGNDRIQFNELKIDKEDINVIDERFRKHFLLVVIRNKFAHNELLPINSYKYCLNNYARNSHEKVASYLNRVFVSIIQELKGN